MNSQIIKLTKKLIKKKSLSPKDSGCQKILKKKLKKNNFIIEDMSYKNTKNFWAYHGKKGKILTFAGHTDVVSPGDIKKWNFNPFSPKIKNGIIYGRGSSDMKGSLAAMIFAAIRFVKKFPNHPGKISFLITSDEECNAKHGTIKVIEKLISRKEKINYCIIGEPTSEKNLCDTIKNGRRGSINIKITIYGTQGHIAYPQLANNPIHNSLSFLHKIIKKKWDEGNNVFPPTNLQISNLHSGIGVNNIIPPKIFIKMNVRFSNKLNEKKIIKKIKHILNEEKLNYKIKWNLSANPFLSKNGKLIQITSDIIKQYFGYTPNLSQNGGTSDGRFIHKICSQIIEIGLFNKTIHKENECAAIKNLKKLSFIYEKIIEKILLKKNI